jgi:hypothetical protein
LAADVDRIVEAKALSTLGGSLMARVVADFTGHFMAVNLPHEIFARYLTSEKAALV